MEVLESCQEIVRDPRIRLKKLREPLDHSFVVRSQCLNCGTVLPVQEKDVMDVAGRVQPSYDEMYISLKKCAFCNSGRPIGAEFKPIPR